MLKKLVSKCRGFVRSSAVKCWVMVVAMFATVSAFAVEGDYSPVAKDAATGVVTFTPSNLTSPLADAVVQGYSSWAVIALIIAGVGLVCWIIFRRK